MYANAYLFYFSGTGNAKNVAEWIAKYLTEIKVFTKLVKIEDSKSIEIENDNSKKLVGIISATHGFNLPPIVLNFVFKFPKLKNTDVFIANTRAGLKLSKLFLPGLSGLAQILPSSVFLIKGFNVVGMQPIDLPSNWISLHPGLKTKVVDSMYVRIQNIIKKFTNNLINGKRNYIALYSLPLDIAISIISVGYYFVGRFMLAKTFIATQKCTSCQLCVKQCPVKALKIIDKRPYWTFNCESCMRCMNNCPQRAIETPHGFLILIWTLLLCIPSANAIKNFIINFQGSIINNQIIKVLWYEQLFYYIAELLVYFGFVWITYRVLYYFMKFKFIDTIISYTSFTKYNFWRRYKAPKRY